MAALAPHFRGSCDGVLRQAPSQTALAAHRSPVALALLLTGSVSDRDNR